jgi:hypothetical protein
MRYSHSMSTDQPSRRMLLRNLGLMTGVGLVRPVMTRALWPELATPPSRNKPAFSVGPFQKIYDPSTGEKEKWYINDHTFIRPVDGQWHLFGITHPEPAAPQQEKFFAHATAPDLAGPWAKREPVMPANEQLGETVVWAPYVLEHDGLYWMYYCAGGKQHEQYHIHLATSSDLFTWKRHPDNPMVVDGYDARDPMVIRYANRWILYYTATSEPHGGNHVVKAATSDDLTRWSGNQEVFVAHQKGTYGGSTESPFVVSRNGTYYLFVCTNRGYNETAVYQSDDPFHWEQSNRIAKFPAHAAEVVQLSNGQWFVSRAGWGQGGVYLAELVWES